MVNSEMRLPFPEILKLVKGGDRVKYWAFCGIGPEGKEYKIGVGKVCGMLIFPTHMVINIGGRHGTPRVVDEENFIAVMLPRGETWESRKAGGENLMRRFL